MPARSSVPSATPVPAVQELIGRETPLALTRRARRINRVLTETYPDAHCELDFTTPLELLVATVLAAQTTDRLVNTVTPALFARYPDALAYAQADRAELEDLVHATGFFRAKAAAVTGLGQALVDRFDGVVPRRLADLVTLPGVGRKTANVVLGNAFGVPGLTVDTHFGRLVRRFGWTGELDPVKVEAVVADLLPRAEWTMFSHRVIWHGRRCCDARRPACERCPLTRDCPSAFLGAGVGADGPAPRGAVKPRTPRKPSVATGESAGTGKSVATGNSGPAPGV